MTNKCKRCGNTPKVEPVIECSFTRWKVRCEMCGNCTESWKDEEYAIKDWNYQNKNFPTCDDCRDYNHGECDESHTATNRALTCPDYVAEKTIFNDNYKDIRKDIKKKTHAENFLNTDFGASADELLGNYKLTAKGELVLENQKNSDKATYWFEKHNEAWEEIADLNKCIADICTDKGKLLTEIQELREEVKYWTNAYNEQVQGREKDMMSLEAIERLLGVSR